MKVRIGIGATGRGLEPAELGELCSSLLEHRFDSIWISEVLTQGGMDPLVALGWLSGRLPTLKLGTTFLVPGRHPLRLARQLATLDHLSGGRLLLTAVPGLTRGPEATAVGLAPAQRGAAMEETLPVLRSLLAGQPTDVVTPAGIAEGIVLDPLPVQQPLEIWLGGSVPRALERCGRFGDGWLPAMITPAAAAAGRAVIEATAESSDRAIDPEHFGVSIGYSFAELSPEVTAQLATRAGATPLAEVVPVGAAALRRLLESYLEVGFSKFVVRPIGPVASWPDELGAIEVAVGDLQT